MSTETPAYIPTGRNRHIQRVAGRIEELQGSIFNCNPERTPSPMKETDIFKCGYHRNVMSSSTGWDTWDGLSSAEKEGVLRRHVDWEGFARHHVKDVIERVICEIPKDRWMEGLQKPYPTSDLARRAQFQKRDDAKGIDR